jgi:hypothetical protein
LSKAANFLHISSLFYQLSQLSTVAASQQFILIAVRITGKNPHKIFINKFFTFYQKGV